MSLEIRNVFTKPFSGEIHWRAFSHTIKVLKLYNRIEFRMEGVYEKTNEKDTFYDPNISNDHHNDQWIS